MVEHTAGETVAADTAAADILAAVDTKPADMGGVDMKIAVDTKPATGREPLDTVAASHLVRYTDYIDQTARILAVASPLVECRSHHRELYHNNFAYHNMYKKQNHHLRS